MFACLASSMFYAFSAAFREDVDYASYEDYIINIGGKDSGAAEIREEAAAPVGDIEVGGDTPIQDLQDSPASDDIDDSEPESPPAEDAPEVAPAEDAPEAEEPTSPASDQTLADTTQNVRRLLNEALDGESKG